MATTRIRINIGDLAALPAQIEALKIAIVKWAQVGLSRFVLNRMKREIPVRSGRLRAALRFRKLQAGGRFHFGKSGFYFIFQRANSGGDLEDRLMEIVKQSLEDLIPWAVRRARAEVGI